MPGHDCGCCHATHAVTVTVLDGGFSDTAVYAAACAVTFAVPQMCCTPPTALTNAKNACALLLLALCGLPKVSSALSRRPVLAR
jgi:hypothetical protein